MEISDENRSWYKTDDMSAQSEVRVKRQKFGGSRLFHFGRYKLPDWVTPSHELHHETPTLLCRNHPSDNAHPCK